MPESNQEPANLRFGRFRVLKALGRGGMGKVYLAEDPVIGREVAIKVVSPGPGLEDDDLEDLNSRFEREFQSAGTLSHPNIVTVYDVGQEGDDTFIAMEFLPGQSWSDILKSNRSLSFGDIADFAGKICGALDYAHTNGIVHRDIKPANILVARDGEPKITDFGVAQLASANLTRTGTVVGTPSYMSPEQITGRTVSGASDQFSIGVILYQMLTGQLPFKGENPTTILYKIVHDPPLRPCKQRNTLPEAVDPVLMRALEKRPEDRFPTCQELANALREGLDVATEAIDFDLHHSEAVDRHRRKARQEAKGGKRRRGLWPALLFMFFAVVIVFVSLYYRDLLLPPQPEAVEPTIVESQSISQPLAVRSDRDGAHIWVAGVDTGLVTPAEVTLAGIAGDDVMLELHRGDQVVARASLLLSETMPSEWVTVEELPPQTFLVASTPSGAQVYLNDELVGGSTPIEIDLVPGEAYQVRVELEEYHSAGTAFDFPDDLDAGLRQSRRFFYELKPKIPPGHIVFESPYPVEVRVAGRSYGPSRSHDISLKPNTYEVRLSSGEVFLDETRLLRVESNDRLNLNLPAVVELRVMAQPGNCRVFVNGRFLDETPFDLRVVPNRYEFRFEWPALGDSRTIVERVTRRSREIFGTPR